MRYWDLGQRAERKYVYGYFLRLGLPLWIYRWVDGALLVDLWDELDLHDPVRRAWQPLITAARHGPYEHPFDVSLDKMREDRRAEIQARR